MKLLVYSAKFCKIIFIIFHPTHVYIKPAIKKRLLTFIGHFITAFQSLSKLKKYIIILQITATVIIVIKHVLYHFNHTDTNIPITKKWKLLYYISFTDKIKNQNLTTVY